MTRGTRWLLAILVGGTLAMALTVGVTAASIYRAGTIEVDVDGAGDDRVAVAVPAGLVHVAIGLTPKALVHDALEELDADLGFVDAIRAGVDELERTPDFVIVRVESPGERVLVEKRGRRIVVRVDGDDGRFRVAIPLRTVKSALRKLDRA